jgi:glucosamine-phosphate N-acetyltransferase
MNNFDIGEKLNIGLSYVAAIHVRLKPGGGSTPSLSAGLRPIELGDVFNGYLEVLDEFSGCPNLLRNPGEALDILQETPYNQAIIVAEVNGKVVGTASMVIFKKVCLDGKSMARIFDVAVLSQYRSFGIGSAMINYLEEIAKKNNVIKLTLECSDKNISYYERFGFEHVSNHMRKIL